MYGRRKASETINKKTLAGKKQTFSFIEIESKSCTFPNTTRLINKLSNDEQTNQFEKRNRCE